MPRIQRFVLTAVLFFSSWSHASTSFLRGDALYQVTDTGGANYVTSQVESSCNGFFTRWGSLNQLVGGGYDTLLTGVTVADPPFFLQGGSLKIVDAQQGVLSVAEDVEEIRYPYFRIRDQLFQWDNRQAAPLVDGVTQLSRNGYLKGNEAFSLQGARSQFLTDRVTHLALPYLLKGDVVYAMEGKQAVRVASGAQALSEAGFFVRGGLAYSVESGGTFRFVKSGVTQLQGNMARVGDQLWWLDPNGSRLLGTGVTQSSRNYFLEGDRLYKVGPQGSVYLGAGVSQLPCSGRFPIYLD